MNPVQLHQNWLQQEFRLPADRQADIGRLLAAEAQGSTAIVGNNGNGDWGNALATVATGEAIPGEPRPLVKVIAQEGTAFLQSWLYYKAEKEIAQSIALRLQETCALTPEMLRDLDALFPEAGTGNLQKKAVSTTLARRLSLITGRPGTGKTYTLARALAMLVQHGIPPADIRLAAPTGKAADRMKKSVGDSIAQLPSPFTSLTDSLKTVAASSQTLHSLLKYHPGTGRCAYRADHPLPFKALIVDECSMVDVLLWRALLAALREDARLILLGDPDQLESVGQGNVLAELVRIAQAGHSDLAKAWVELEVSHRFQSCPNISALAEALVKNKPGTAQHLLEHAAGPNPPDDLLWVPSAKKEWSALPPSIQTALETVAVAPSPQQAIAALGQISILTAQREHFVGALAISQMIQHHFQTTCATTPNQPIIINRNDPETGLKNGSVGIVHTGPQGIRKAWFPPINPQEGPREFSLAQLPDFSPAWALTIHRSQGSEYDHVLVMLPQADSPMATRELIYTAITRARKRVVIAGDLHAILAAIANPSNRLTMLGRFLADTVACL